jgi:SdpI/YfhL protein family
MDAMAMLRTLFIGLPALMFALGVPLALRLVPPNRFFGFRTSTTFSSLDAWYQINYATGLAMMAAGVAGGLFALVLSYGVTWLKPEARYLTGVLLTALAMAAFFIPVVIYSARFGSD